MDDVIQFLDDMRNKGELSEVTHGVLRRLAKKRKKERFWFNVKNTIGLGLSFGYLLLLFLLKPLLTSHGITSSGFIEWLMMNTHLLLITALIILQVGFKIVIDKYDEADGKYDRLRKEVLDREVEIWNRHLEDNKSRACILHLFDQHKVNLFHK